jgi:hypothetical protein
MKGIKWVGEMKNSYRIFIGKPKGRRPVGRSRCIRESNIKMEHKNIGCEGMNWIHFVQGRGGLLVSVNMVKNLWGGGGHHCNDFCEQVAHY